MTGEKFTGCIIGGAIGDAWGSSYENKKPEDSANTFYMAGIPAKTEKWQITDDTQLTLATCEALADSYKFSPELLCRYFIAYKRKLTGAGAATLKAITELEAGGHWSQVGRTGEYAAGNGAAMRIAPLAFFPDITRGMVQDICRITHRNDEAYTGALAVYLSIRAILNNEWNGSNNLFDCVIPRLPDTRVKDRLIEINKIASTASIKEVAVSGTNGYVVNSVPFALFAASQVLKTGFTDMMDSVISSGGDTDTNASIAGQVSGALLGVNDLPSGLILKLKETNSLDAIYAIINKTIARL